MLTTENKNKLEKITLPAVTSDWFDAYAGDAPAYLAKVWEYRANINEVVKKICENDKCREGQFENFINFISGKYFDCLKCINEAYIAILEVNDFYDVVSSCK